MTAKERLDKPGRHAVYDQLGNVQTHNTMVWMWVLLQLSKNSDQDLHACTPTSTESEIDWTEGVDGRYPYINELLHLQQLPSATALGTVMGAQGNCLGWWCGRKLFAVILTPGEPGSYR